MNKNEENFDRQLAKWQQIIEDYLPESYPVPSVEAGGRGVEAARYSLLGCAAFCSSSGDDPHLFLNPRRSAVHGR